MNGTSRPKGGPPTTAIPPSNLAIARDDLLQRVIRAQEAIEDGDTYYALGILEGIERDLTPEPRRRFSCGVCGLQFLWPGELDHHVRFVHALWERSQAMGKASA